MREAPTFVALSRDWSLYIPNTAVRKSEQEDSSLPQCQRPKQKIFKTL